MRQSQLDWCEQSNVLAVLGFDTVCVVWINPFEGLRVLHLHDGGFFVEAGEEFLLGHGWCSECVSVRDSLSSLKMPHYRHIGNLYNNYFRCFPNSFRYKKARF